jgi:hypothetical protein
MRADIADRAARLLSPHKHHSPLPSPPLPLLPQSETPNVTDAATVRGHVHRLRPELHRVDPPGPHPVQPVPPLPQPRHGVLHQTDALRHCRHQHVGRARRLRLHRLLRGAPELGRARPPRRALPHRQGRPGLGSTRCPRAPQAPGWASRPSRPLCAQSRRRTAPPRCASTASASAPGRSVANYTGTTSFSTGGSSLLARVVNGRAVSSLAWMPPPTSGPLPSTREVVTRCPPPSPTRPSSSPPARRISSRASRPGPTVPCSSTISATASSRQSGCSSYSPRPRLGLRPHR